MDIETFITDNIKYAYEKFGILGILLVVLTTGIAYLSFGLCKNYMSYVAQKVLVGAPPSKMTDSMFFNKMDVMLKFRIDRLKIVCPLRYRVFTDLIKIKVNDKIESYSKIRLEDISDLNNSEFKKFWEDKILQTDKDVLCKWMNSKIPMIAVEKYVDFSQDSAETIISFVNNVCDSDKVYENNLEKSVAILDFISGISEMSLIAAEKAVVHINGELSGQTYMGFKCEEDKCKVIGCEFREAKHV